LVALVKPQLDEQAILAIERPHRSLWNYYLLCCCVIPPLFPILVLPHWFRYHTLRYKFTAEGISMSWGILFRREIILNYARIQDIHLRSNIVERWFGLARVLVQTASGSSSAEMVIEGVKEFDTVRDFLYSKMRGVKDHPPRASTPPPHKAIAATTGEAELAAVLREVARELREVRQALESRGMPPRSSGKEAGHDAV
jgi:putative membrane protein